ncbi:HIT family protein [Corynebacterium aquilae]|uniref:HIT family hydrolase n=1 Tax=Corynebacterium aquilae DSM 44791 TaxID=1431546 RepID=A0A1L7CI61_9CORY|nr:HIT family protein [Corynebacterium aquilae]APT85453.1 HIT family hydrolase [Corynebacterium aquilae DSM 44791]
MSTVFSKILTGEIPGRFVYRDEDVAAFLDISPQTYGHTLVIPTQEVDRWTDLDPATLNKVMAVAQAIGKAQVEVFDAPRAGQMIIGFDVPHAHIHVFPAWGLSDFTGPGVESPEEDKMDAAHKALAEKMADFTYPT